MGNLGLSQANFTIAVMPPQGKAFNFHRDYRVETDPQPISYPSFLSKDDAQAVSYCNRSNFQFRQFELSFEREHNASAIIFTKISQKVEDIWKNLAPNEAIPLTEGCVFKLGETQFEIKKLCYNFADLEEWGETLHTLTDADPREKGSFNVQTSINLQNSRMSRDGGVMAQSRHFNTNQSVASSFGFDQ